MYRVSPFLRNYAGLLLAGAGLATAWVNLAPDSYFDFIETFLFEITLPGRDAPVPFTLARLVGEGLMSFFLLFVGKELWEAMVLERGTLRGQRAVLPLSMAAGGVLGAVAVYLALHLAFETAEESMPGSGWAIPAASDVVLAYAAGMAVFGAGHPALRILLLMTIADDIVGLILLGISGAGDGLRPAWLILTAAAVAVAFVLFNWLPRRLDRGNQLRPWSSLVRRRLSVWPYLAAGVLSWIGVAASGLPPALGLLPIIPAIPHADRAFGLFAEAEEMLGDTLNRLKHLLVRPVAAVLFLFGLTHGAFDLAALAPTTLIVLGALIIGKPLGVTAGAALATAAGFLRPAGLTLRDIGLIGLIAAVGFTVPLLGLTAALPGGAMAEGARLGLGLSLLAVPLALLIARLPTKP